MNTAIRTRLLVPFVGMLLLWGVVASGDDSTGGLLGCWRFDEGEGVYSANSANSADPAGEAELHNVSWVKGPLRQGLAIWRFQQLRHAAVDCQA